MKKLTKLLLIGGTLSSVIFLGACSESNSDSNPNSDSNVVTIDGVNITSKSLIESVESSIGEDNMKQIFLFEYLDSKYKVSEKEIEEKLKELDNMYGGEGAGINYLKEYYRYTDERINEIMKEEIQVEKALKEYKNITDKDIKEVFDKDGNNISREVLEIHFNSQQSTPEQIDKFNNMLKDGKSLEEIKKSISETDAIQVDNKEYTNFDLSDINADLIGSKKGEIIKIDNSETYGAISLYLILNTKELKLEDVEQKITQSLIYSDANYKAWLYNEIIESKDITISNKQFDYIKNKIVIEGEDVSSSVTNLEESDVEVETKEESE